MKKNLAESKNDYTATILWLDFVLHCYSPRYVATSIQFLHFFSKVISKYLSCLNKVPECFWGFIRWLHIRAIPKQLSLNRKNYLNWVFSLAVYLCITNLRCRSPHILRLRPSHLQHIVRIFALVDRSMILSWDLISFMARRGLLLKLGGSLTNSFFFNIFDNYFN